MPRKTKAEKNAETVYNLQNSIKGMYNAMMNFHRSHERLREDKNRMMENPDYIKLPVWAKMQLHGYDSAMRERFYDWLEDKWELDGKLYVRGPERDEAFSGRWNEVIYRGKYYPGTDIHYGEKNEP